MVMVEAVLAGAAAAAVASVAVLVARRSIALFVVGSTMTMALLRRFVIGAGGPRC